MGLARLPRSLSSFNLRRSFIMQIRKVLARIRCRILTRLINRPINSMTGQRHLLDPPSLFAHSPCSIVAVPMHATKETSTRTSYDSRIYASRIPYRQAGLLYETLM